MDEKCHKPSFFYEIVTIFDIPIGSVSDALGK
jgi:hypothetical protein